MENKRYDIIIVGAGPSGIFCAYKLIQERKDLKVLIVEKGNSIEKFDFKTWISDNYSNNNQQEEFNYSIRVRVV